jgi:hypothetical protein
MKLLNQKVLVLLVTLVLISLLSRGARADSLTGWWKLDELSGTVAYDSSGSGNDGTVYGDAGWQDGVMLASLELDATDDWVDISNPADYSTEADFTWSSWVKLLDGQVITDGGVIIAKCPATGDYGNGAKCLYVADDGKLKFNVYGVGTLSTETHVNDGLWHHVALTVEFETSGSNDTAKLYIDGDPDGSRDNWNVNEYDESDSLKIGFANSNFPQSPDQTYFYGRIDDVRIYDYVLNADEIAGLFEDSGLWKFVVTGDSRDDGSGDGVNDEILGEIANAIIKENADLVVFPGDLVYGYCNQTTLRTQLIKWLDTMQPVYDAGIAVYPVRGNHDVGVPAGVTAWNNVFSGSYALPDNGPEGEVNLTYSVAHKNALIVGMDVYIEAHKVNQDWLNGVLAGNTRQHVFVFTHELAFGLDGDGAHDDGLYGDKGAIPPIDCTEERDEFWASLEAEPGFCRLYFCGHDHFYDHLKAVKKVEPDPETEVHQMIVGTAGAQLSDFTGEDYYHDSDYWTPTKIKHEKQYGYVVVEISGPGGTSVTAVWKHRTGAGTYEPGGDLFSYTIPCLLHCCPEYNDWLTLKKPNCWCGVYGNPTWPYQCDGDADNLIQGILKYRVYTNDFNIMVANWQKTITDPDLNPCADFDRKPQGVLKYRVYTNDFNILVGNWKKTDTQLPGNCSEYERCQEAQGKSLNSQEIVKWLEQIWLDEEVQKLIDKDVLQKFIESLKEEL